MKLLNLLRRKARASFAELAESTGSSEKEVEKKITDWENDGTILGYHAVTNPEASDETTVSAFISVKLSPERGGGFDRLATRISRFDQVESCHLASGGFDLLVLVEGEDLRDVASFVSEKLATLDGVLSTTTHFRLKTYKEKGFMFEAEPEAERLSVTP